MKTLFRSFQSLSFITKSILLALLVLITVFISMLMLDYFTLRESVQQYYQSTADTLSKAVTNNFTDLPLDDKAKSEISKQIASCEKEHPHVWYHIQLHDSNTTFTSSGRWLKGDLPDPNADALTSYDGWYDQQYPLISAQGETIGTLYLAVSVKNILLSMHMTTLTHFILAALCGLISMALALFLKNKIVYNVKKLNKASWQIAQGDYGFQLSYEETNNNPNDPFYQTFQSFNTMSLKLKETMDLLQDSKDLFKSLLYSSKDAKILLDENFIIYQANKACLNFCNAKTTDELIGKNLDVFNFNDPEGVLDKTLHIAQKGKSPLNNDPSLTFQTNNGKTLTVQLTVTKSKINEKSFYLVALHDISQYYYHTARIRDSEMHIRAIIATAIDAIIILNQEGKVTEFNPAAEQLFGYYDENLIGLDFAKLFIPIDLQDHFSYILSFYYENHQQEDNSGSRNLMTMQDKNKKTFPAELTMTTFTQHDQLYLILFIRDISSRIESESMLLEARYNADQANQAKTRFLATVSHEIRTPLSGIIGVLELIDDITRDKEQRKLLNHAQYNAQNLLTILNDLIDWSQADQDKLSLNPAAFDIKDLLISTKNLMQPLAEQKDLPFLFEVQGDLPETVYGDAGRIRQILLNLLSNAIKFTEKGYIQLQVKSTPSTKADHVKIHIAIKDTGFGISAEEQKFLFHDFVRSAHTREKNIRGTGLGLAISHKLLELMDSHIDLESEWGKGSTFSFNLELKIMDSLSEDKPAETAEEIQIKPNESGVILIAEDVQTSQFILSKQLTDAGYECHIADDGQQALDLTMQQQFDIILMDVAMPKLTGILATQKIRENPDNINHNTPIIGISAHMGQSEKDKCIAAGMTEFLTKPVLKNQLLSLMKRYITQKNNNMGFAQPITDVHSWLKSIPTKVISEILEQLSVDTSEEFIHQIFTTFINDSEDLLETLQCATEDQLVDPAIHRAAHSLKGASSSLGLIGIGTLAKECEEAILRRDFTSFKETLNKILIEHGKLAHYVRQR